MKRNVLFASLLLLVSGVAFAQMGGGHRFGNPPNHGPGSGMSGPGMDGAPAHRTTVVAEDGTAFVLRRADANGDGIFEPELVAVRSTGTIAWTAPLDVRMARIELFGDLLVTASSPFGATFGPNDSVPPLSTQVAAYAVASGVRQWELQIDGVVFDLEASTAGLYATVLKPAQARYAARSLLLIDNHGAIVWTLPLD